MTDVKNVKEVLVALNMVSLVLIKQLRDGFQVADVGAAILEIMASDETKAALVAAIEGITALPAEIADFQLAEGIELALVQLDYLPKILEALKK